MACMKRDYLTSNFLCFPLLRASLEFERARLLVEEELRFEMDMVILAERRRASSSASGQARCATGQASMRGVRAELVTFIFTARLHRHNCRTRFNSSRGSCSLF